jgi:hypothetical protein
MTKTKTEQQDKALALAETIARMTLEKEMRGGMTSEDAIATMNDLIQSARDITNINPEYPTLYCTFCGADIEDCDCDNPNDEESEKRC